MVVLQRGQQAGEALASRQVSSACASEPLHDTVSNRTFFVNTLALTLRAAVASTGFRVTPDSIADIVRGLQRSA